MHHIVTNSPEHDPDIQHLPFFAVSTKFFQNVYSSYYHRRLEFDRFARVFVQMQHYLFYVVLSFGRFNLYAQSLIFLKDRSPNKNFEIVCMLGFWSWYMYLLSHMPSWPMAIGFVFVSHLPTCLLHVQITISHFGMATDDVEMETFAEKAMRTTMDVECPEWLDWLHGGLQFQVIHHLFPRIPRHNFRKVKPLIIQFAKENGLTYHSHGFVKSNWVVLSALKDIANQVQFLAKVAEHQVSEMPTI